MDFIKDYVKNNNLQLKNDRLDSEYKCGVCSNVLHKPKSSKCGCSYCTDCLSRCDIRDKCPSCNTTLDFDNDVACDFRLERQILKIMMCCPNTFCEEFITVEEMKAHLQTCSKKGVQCIFHEYGCTTFHRRDKMHEHITQDLTNHLEMLVVGIGSYENGIRRLNENMEKKLDENGAANLIHFNTIDEKLEDLNGKVDKSQETAKLDMETMKKQLTKQTDVKLKKEIDKVKLDMNTENDRKIEKVKVDMAIEHDKKMIAEIEIIKHDMTIQNDTKLKEQITKFKLEINKENGTNLKTEIDKFKAHMKKELEIKLKDEYKKLNNAMIKMANQKEKETETEKDNKSNEVKDKSKTTKT